MYFARHLFPSKSPELSFSMALGVWRRQTCQCTSAFRQILRARAYISENAPFAFIQAAAQRDPSFIQTLLETCPFLQLSENPRAPQPPPQLNTQPISLRVAHTLAKGANVVLYNRPECALAIHWAAKGRHNALLKRLVSAGANVLARDVHGQTALHLCAVRGNARGVKALLEGGADVNALDLDGLTPLHYACQYGLEVVQALVEAGADIDAVDKAGKTVLYYAVHHALEVTWRSDNDEYAEKMESSSKIL
ncbi:ankyrin [Choiromyces venosus 120613-1]|uniref:Ankyrin repeat domain-containing protein 54 n=1 Tax=Choiromyces venosus 120613-1 TaxID=1336337 RepID=A0A3N4JKR0_9PEZI|nr:ankyrin [Choiromyces venosus 120613-1]